MTEKYFLFKCIKGDYYTVDLNKVWDDIYDYLHKKISYIDYDEDLVHISIPYKKDNISYLEVGFLLSNYIKPDKHIRAKEIEGGFFTILQETGGYRECLLTNMSTYYRKHLNSTDEVSTTSIKSEVYVLLR